MIIIRDRDFNDKSLFHKNLSIGGKAQGLISLRNSGLNVPPFSVISDFSGEETEKDIENLIYEEVRRGFINPEVRFSVRSSASSEDSAEHSFAGVFDTFLGVDIVDIPSRVIECLRSLGSERAETYLLENHIPADEIRMNVIIQEMAGADYSGVLFTENPSGIISESVIVTGEGSGENIVQGRVPVSTTYYSNLEDVHYIEREEGSPEIPLKIIKDIREKGILMQNELKYPCDIEFSIKDGQVSYLQVRPVTAGTGGERTVLDNSNLTESYPGICLPLTDTFVREAYAGVFRGLASSIIKNKAETEPFEERLDSMVTSSSGRMYYKINNWYFFLGFLPFSRRITKIWQEMMGVTTRDLPDLKEKTSVITRMKAKINFIREFFRVPQNMENLNSRFSKVRDYYEENIVKDLDNEELKKLYWELNRKVMDGWHVTLMNDLYAFIFTSFVRGKKGNLSLDSVSQLESMKPLRELSAVAQDMPDGLNIKTASEAADYLSGKSDFIYRVNNFINEYGDRNVGELKLESETFRTNPALIFKKMEELKKSPLKFQEQTGPQAETPKFFITKKLWENAAAGIRNREISRLNRTRLYGMVREIVLLMGYNLKNDMRIDRMRDVFYLTMEELFRAEEIDDLRRIINERKRKYTIFSKVPEYTRIEFAGEEFDRIPVNLTEDEHFSDDLKELIGTGASRGRIKAPALVIDSPEGDYDARGKIIVCHSTDPGWIYLISQCAGLVTEMGSLLSHSAIITRELKKPSVVGVKTAARKIKTGDIIEIDGSSGIIRTVSGIDSYY